MAQVETIGWEEDFRYQEEHAESPSMSSKPQRTTDSVLQSSSIHPPKTQVKTFSKVYRDMLMKFRYRYEPPDVILHFKEQEWIADGDTKHVRARLHSNEDADLSTDKIPNLEWLDEIQ